MQYKIPYVHVNGLKSTQVRLRDVYAQVCWFDPNFEDIFVLKKPNVLHA